MVLRDYRYDASKFVKINRVSELGHFIILLSPVLYKNYTMPGWLNASVDSDNKFERCWCCTTGADHTAFIIRIRKDKLRKQLLALVQEVRWKLPANSAGKDSRCSHGNGFQTLAVALSGNDG